MLLSCRDIHIKRVLDDILGFATIYGVHIDHIDCSVKILLKKAETILRQIEISSPPFGVTYGFIDPNGDFCC